MIVIDRLNFIDGLRGLAALDIIIYHMGYIPQPILELPYPIDRLLNVGGSGILLFYIISGFGIFFSLDTKRYEDNRSLKFYIRRIFRIAPLFYVVLIYYLAISLIVYQYLPSAKQILVNFLFIFNLFPESNLSLVPAGWMVGAEMILYLFAPLLFSRVNNFFKSVALLVGALFLTNTVNFMLAPIISTNYPSLAEQYLFHLFTNQIQFLAIGIMCYFVYRDFIMRMESMPRLAYSCFMFFLFISIYYMLLFKIQVAIQWNYLLQALAMGCLFLGFASFSSIPLRYKLAGFYGKISYSTYLLHPIIIGYLIPVYRYIYDEIHLNAFANFCLCVLLTLMLLTPISFLTHRLIEKPFIKYGRKLIGEENVRKIDKT